MAMIGPVFAATQQSGRGLSLAIFGVILASTLAISFWAARKIHGASDFWSAGRQVNGVQNGLAVAGEFLSAAAFLGVSGLMFMSGFDGYLTGIAALCSFVPLLLLLAERMRNAGKFTMTDVLAFRLREGPARVAVAVTTLCIAAFYVIAQSVAAGALFEALVGIPFWVSVLVTVAAMLSYVVLGGMIATTWVQIIKACLLLGGVSVMAIWILSRYGFNPIHLMNAATEKSADGKAYNAPGLLFTKPLDEISTGVAFVLGTCGLPHIMMRFLTVTNARAARRSVGWAVGLIGVFYLFVAVIGLGSRAILGKGGEALAGKGGNLAAPYLAQHLGGGAGTTGGDIFFACITAVAFATILAVVAGVVLAGTGAVAHDLYGSVIRRGRASEEEEVRAARLAVVAIGAVGAVLALLAGKGFNVQLLTGLTFAVAASANFPSLLLTLTWRRFNTTGAVTGITVGLVVAIGLIIFSPPVWPGPDSNGAPFPLANPAIISIPAGFLACVLGTLLGRDERRADERYEELLVRAETGIGAEMASREPVGAAR
jgi:cation/acetate symporter